jgi:hypothetical protein
MSRYPYPRHSYKTPPNLDLYLFVEKRKLKNVDAKFQVEVGHWAPTNHLKYRAKCGSKPTKINILTKYYAIANSSHLHAK